MFIGHFALGFGAKRFAPQVSLGILFLACQLADIIWPNLVLFGIETLEIQPGEEGRHRVINERLLMTQNRCSYQA
jgi:hypothetical protein